MPARKSNKPKKTLNRGPRPKQKKSSRRPKKISAVLHPSAAAKRAGTLFESFVALQSRLCAPGGCPWDREQTHESLQTYLLEESYEVLDAISSGNPEKLTDELGDLLLQVVFHAELARESGKFDIADVVEGIHNKMIRRHPHVFGDVIANTSSQVVKNWDQIKAAEKQNARTNDVQPSVSILDGVPRNLPALLEASQLTSRAAKVGFDWISVDGILEKLSEEKLELLQAIENDDPVQIQEELGDLFFVVVNLSRFLGIDPEVALKDSNRKFKLRFNSMENAASDRDQTLNQLSKEQLEVLWVEAKDQLKASRGQRRRG